MLLHPTEMDVKFMKVLQQGSKGRALGHLGEGIDILGEALTTITELAVGSDRGHSCHVYYHSASSKRGSKTFVLYIFPSG